MGAFSFEPSRLAYTVRQEAAEVSHARHRLNPRPEGRGSASIFAIRHTHLVKL